MGKQAGSARPKEVSALRPAAPAALLSAQGRPASWRPSWSAEVPREILCPDPCCLGVSLSPPAFFLARGRCSRISVSRLVPPDPPVTSVPCALLGKASSAQGACAVTQRRLLQGPLWTGLALEHLTLVVRALGPRVGRRFSCLWPSSLPPGGDRCGCPDTPRHEGGRPRVWHGSHRQTDGHCRRCCCCVVGPEHGRPSPPLSPSLRVSSDGPRP